MVSPRPGSWKAENLTTTMSEMLGDPAAVVLARYDAQTRGTETSDAALARIISALSDFLPAWHRDPARGCADMAPATFVGKGAKARAASFAACGRCPANIRRSCLAWAVETGDVVSIMGGTDGPARRRLIAERQRQREADRQTDDPDDYPDPDNYPEEYPDATPR